MNSNGTPYRWALPEGIEVPPDELQVRLDFYRGVMVLHIIEDGVITTKPVSPTEVARVLLSEVPIDSGLLPQDALWWKQGRDGAEIALWRDARVWPVALQLRAFKPPKRLKLPMPGLIFICQPGRGPRVFAAKRRPVCPTDAIFHAPVFNVFDDGRSCPGTHQYPADVAKIPESFFLSFFTVSADYGSRSKKYPGALLQLWEELDGKSRYPLGDLVAAGKVEDII